MSRLLDINMWIALTVETHPHHPAARRWYHQVALSRGELVFCRQTELGFLRLITQSAVMQRCQAEALKNSEAIEFITNLHRDPAVSFALEPRAVRKLWLELADHSQPAPHRWMDAYLAAFAICLGAQLVTFDRDFSNYLDRGLDLQLLEVA